MWGRLKCSDLMCALMIPLHRAGPDNKSSFTEVFTWVTALSHGQTGTRTSRELTAVSHSLLNFYRLWVARKQSWGTGPAVALEHCGRRKDIDFKPCIAYCLLPLLPLWMYYTCVPRPACLRLWFTVVLAKHVNQLFCQRLWYKKITLRYCSKMQKNKIYCLAMTTLHNIFRRFNKPLSWPRIQKNWFKIISHRF